MKLIYILMGMLSYASCATAAGMDLTADHIQQHADKTITATGHARVVRDDEVLQTDRLVYQPQTHTLHATGHVHIHSDNRDIYAQSAQINTKQRTGDLNLANITLSTGEHIQAQHISRLPSQQLVGEDVRLSVCPKDDEAWHVDAKHVQVKQQEGVIEAQQAWFYLGQVPVLYTPYWQQPLRRRSGLLLPSFSSSSQRGTEFSLPYYWAPRPNWDVTITPRWMSLRGVMGDVEMRHATQYGHQTLQWSAIQDQHTHQYRQQIQADIQQNIDSQWQLNSHINHVSDRQFLSDFALNNQQNATAYTHSTADIIWRSDQADVQLSAQIQQNLTQANDQNTLQILPRLESHYSHNIGFAQLHLDQQTTRFSRIIGTQGTRIVLHPWLNMPFSWMNHAITSDIQWGVRHMRYQNIQGAAAQAAQNIMDLSLTQRMDFEHISNTHTWRHAISPIIRYDLAYAPQQTSNINFDSGFSQLTMGNLMQGNRFTGLDRFERMNRLSFLLENSLQHKQSPHANAQTLMTSYVGVAYDFLRQYVDRNLQRGPLRPFSNILTGMTLTPMQSIQLSGQGQFDPVGHYWSTAQAGLNLTHSHGHHLNISWQRIDPRYSIASETIHANAAFTLSPRWKISTNTQYDAKLKRTQESSVGLDYQHACWSLNTEIYRNFHTGTNNTMNTGVRFLLGFRGLGSLGGS